jgi:hypothetical protein
MNYNPLFEGQDGELVSFVCRFVEENGALVEAGADRIDLLLPAPLADALGVDEYISVSPGSDPGTPSHGRTLYPIHFGAPLLERISAMAGSNPPLVELSLVFDYLKKGGYEALIKQQFEFYKATGTVSGTGEVKTRYLILTCRYLAQSDEQKEGLVDLAVNMDNKAVVPAMADKIAFAEKQYKKTLSHHHTKAEIEKIIQLADRYVSEAVQHELFEFKKSMNRRFLRDASSLDEYYTALGREMNESLERTGLSDKLRLEREEKIALIPGELAAKQKDLLNKYGIRVKVSLAAVMAVTTPGVKVLFNAVAGKQRRTLSMLYNPVTKLMDPLVCERCGQSMYRIAFSRELRLVCPSCQ